MAGSGLMSTATGMVPYQVDDEQGVGSASELSCG